jgi:hypothetical protein
MCDVVDRARACVRRDLSVALEACPCRESPSWASIMGQLIFTHAFLQTSTRCHLALLPSTRFAVMVVVSHLCAGGVVCVRWGWDVRSPPTYTQKVHVARWVRLLGTGHPLTRL